MIGCWLDVIWVFGLLDVCCFFFFVGCFVGCECLLDVFVGFLFVLLVVSLFLASWHAPHVLFCLLEGAVSNISPTGRVCGLEGAEWQD